MSANQSGRVMALDIGRVRVGVAISDPLGITAQPGPTLEDCSDEQLAAALSELIKQYQIRRVVVGLPLTAQGTTKNDSCQMVQKQTKTLQQMLPQVDWVLWDERFTTTQAIHVLRGAPRKKRQAKGARDRIAAQLILQSYLDSL